MNQATPARQKIDAVDFGVDEHIWGHRLYDEQLPHLTVLEFLSVLGSNLDQPLRELDGEGVRYRPQRQIRLRGLLFNNPYVEAVRDRPVSDVAKWEQWEALFRQGAPDLGDRDLGYLREVFSSFEDFAKAIELLRSSAFEARSNKRWSSKFVFPFGPDALYEDLRFDSRGGISNDRRFFARTGELLYLMLSRARRGAELGDLLVQRLFDRQAPMNRLVRALQHETDTAEGGRPVGYLPYARHPRFDRLCEDWLAILSRDIPVYDALDHLIVITGLNLLLYFLEAGSAAAGDADSIEFLCEIVSRERTKVRSLSGESYQHNDALSLRAIRADLEAIKRDPRWAAALHSRDSHTECVALLQARHDWPPAEGRHGDDFAGQPGDEMLQKLMERAEARHKDHVGQIHSSWARAIGLSSRRLSRRMRYAPNDRLLKTLVVTVVEDRMQFDEFLTALKERYGLILGDVEGRHLILANAVDQEALSDNRHKLETRLEGLGLVRRLSDSCSFVENPFVVREDC